jgi:hypothetical protein
VVQWVLQLKEAKIKYTNVFRKMGSFTLNLYSLSSFVILNSNINYSIKHTRKPPEIKCIYKKATGNQRKPPEIKCIYKKATGNQRKPPEIKGSHRK